jgi:GGDEF domain-containing protein
VRDPSERPEPEPPRRPATARSRRPKFALPADPPDERTSERIEAFLDGPKRERRSRPRHLRSEALRRPRRSVPIDTRTDWDAALRQEDARVARYGRPAAVIVIDLQPSQDGLQDRFAARVGSVLREHARETDRVARVGPTRFHVLLPETSEPEAAILAERVRATCAGWGTIGPGLPVTITAVTATPRGGGTLAEALQDAQTRMADLG